MISAAPLLEARLTSVKRAYTTRRVPQSDMAQLLSGDDVSPMSGDLVLARVLQLGHHTNLENTDGRRAKMFVNDEIIVCYGSRYATAQFEAETAKDLSPCHLAAAGGVAGMVVSAHAAASQPTKIEPIGLVADAKGQVLNLQRYAVEPTEDDRPDMPVFVVLGTAMSSGKTTTTASLVRGLSLSGLSAGAGKVTGTGAGGDYWRFIDAGADTALDFVDFGFASTAGLAPDDVTTLFDKMIATLAASGCDAAVIEVADGLFQKETHALISSQAFRDRITATLFSADSAVSAIAGVQWLASRGIGPKAISGLLTRSPLAIKEVRGWTDVPVFKPKAIADPVKGSDLWREFIQPPLSQVSQSGN